MRSRRHRFDIAATAKTAVFLPPSLGWGMLEANENEGTTLSYR